jgi:ribose-phosphate pyrophosphokinase
MKESMDELKVFTGNAHPNLAQAVTTYLGIPLGKCEVFQFSNENTFVRILENVRQRDVFVIQPLASPVNQNLVELLIMLDAFKRASAGRITAVIPYYSYGRTDKKDQPRVPITARLIADLLTVAGANRLLTVDLHAPQIQGFFSIPVDELTAEHLLSDYFKKRDFDDLVVVATDIGISKRARDVAAELNAPLAIMEKRRIGNADQTDTLNVIGEVTGKVALTVDDEIDTAGSLVNTVSTLIDRGVKEVYSCCTHPVFSGPAIRRIASSPVKEVVVTDSLPVTEKKKLDKITVLSIAPILGEAIHRIHTGQSIGAMFEQE